MNKDKILRGILILVYLVCGAKLLLMWLEPSPTEKLNQELKDISYVQQTAVAEVTTKANLKFTNISKFLETNIGVIVLHLGEMLYSMTLEDKIILVQLML